LGSLSPVASDSSDTLVGRSAQSRSKRRRAGSETARRQVAKATES